MPCFLEPCVEPCWALLSLVSNLRHDLDFTWQFRYHPAVRFGCCWPLQIAPADVRRYGKTGEDVGLPRGRRQFEGSFGWGRHFSKLAQVFLISEGLSKCEAVKSYRWMFRIFLIPISWTWIHFKIRKTSQTSLPTFETWFAKPIVLKEAKCLCLLKAFGHVLLDLCHQLHRSCTATRLQSRYWDMLRMQPWDISPTHSSHYFGVTCNFDLWGKMMSKTSQSRLSATLHLSVVPRSAVSHGKERHLVAAIQFAATMDSWQSKRSGFVMMSSGRWCAQRCSQHLKVIES